MSPATIEHTSRVEVSAAQLEHWNDKLSYLSPQQVLEWAIVTFPNLYQTTAFGLTGLVILDMLSKLNDSHPTDLIFIDTLHHFPQTLDLVDRVSEKYPLVKLHVFKPDGCSTEQEFASKHGEQLWETDDESYDYYAKVEPTQRAYKELNVCAVFTGRRRSQGGARGSLPVVEIDHTSQIIKINPLASWDFDQVHSYVKENDVPYNELLDLGYKSVGDYHSTQPVASGEDERSGRWKGKQKSECGIHEASKFAKFLKEQKKGVQ